MKTLLDFAAREVLHRHPHFNLITDPERVLRATRAGEGEDLFAVWKASMPSAVGEDFFNHDAGVDAFGGQGRGHGFTG